MIQDARDYANKYGYKLICVSREPMRINNAKVVVDASVHEFLSLLKQCEIFFCDSFHGICLSVRLKKQFYVYDREDGKKIKDICDRLGLEGRMVLAEKSDLYNWDELIDYVTVYEKLDEEKKKSFAFLDKALSN